MERELRLTEDGSHTFFVKSLDESYHSVHGALRESIHVFIEQGFRLISKSPICILELGFGTGLNLLLTLDESVRSENEVFYHAVEKYPLNPTEVAALNYEQFVHRVPSGSLIKMHEAPWEKEVQLTDRFRFFKEQSDFRSMDPPGNFDLVYFDAFAPDKQPLLWTSEIFTMIYNLVNPGGILVSYTSKGSVRRALTSCGFDVRKIPGPPGKREMIRATRI